jgi:hypothetical protein
MSRQTLLGHWVHAHERDTAGAKVYVNAAEPLPPSRGRQHLSFRPDGTFIEGMPGPDDRPAQASGSFRFSGGVLTLQRADGSQPVVYEVIVDSEKACLRLSKP